MKNWREKTFILGLAICLGAGAGKMLADTEPGTAIPSGSNPTWLIGKNTNLTIELQGPFGSAAGVIKTTLEKYLKKRLGRTNLENPDGETVKIILQAEAERWQDLAFTQLASLNDLDAFTIDATQANTVRISARTAQAAAYGLFHLLENYLGIYWLFPGELGECVPRSESVGIPMKKETVSPALVSRMFTGLHFRAPQWVKPPYTEGVAKDERTFFWADDFQKNLKLHGLFYASHAMIRIFPVKESREKHPEIFPIAKNGQRRLPDPEKDGTGDGQCWHPCYTNPKTP